MDIDFARTALTVTSQSLDNEVFGEYKPYLYISSDLRNVNICSHFTIRIKAQAVNRSVSIQITQP